MKIEKVGELPVNSRCTIDYTQSPPTINFEYPDKDTSVVRRSSVTFLIAMVFAILIIMCYAVFFSDIFPPPNININQAFIYNNDSILISYTAEGATHYAKISPSLSGFFWRIYEFKTQEFRANVELIVQFLFLLAFFLSLTWLFSHIIGFFFKNTKTGQKTFPELNKRMHDKHYSAEFTPEEVVDNKVELPLFQNMYMDYEAEGDFAEQLIKISIIEHPFSKLVRRKGKPFSKMTEKKKPQVYLWKAIFEFKEKPKDCKLEIRFT